MPLQRIVGWALTSLMLCLTTPIARAQSNPTLPPINTREDLNRLLSNFHKVDSPLIDKYGIAYSSVEHAYQSAKTKNLDQKRAIASRQEAQDAWNGLGGLKAYRSLLGKKQLEYDENFPEKKLLIMEDLLRQKFSQPRFKKTLLQTGEHPLRDIDPTKRDTFWSVCPKGEGRNHFGILLEKIREDLQKEAPKKVEATPLKTPCLPKHSGSPSSSPQTP